MLKPAKGLGFDVEVRGQDLLRYPLQHVRMHRHIFKETFARGILELRIIACVFLNEHV